MNRIENLPQYDFAFSAHAVKFMQDAYSALEQLAKLGGENYIISGCDRVSTGNVFNTGWIVLDGEVLYFVGGNYSAITGELYVRVKETTTTITVRDASRTEKVREAELTGTNSPTAKRFDLLRRIPQHHEPTEWQTCETNEDFTASDPTTLVTMVRINNRGRCEIKGALMSHEFSAGWVAKIPAGYEPRFIQSIPLFIPGGVDTYGGSNPRLAYIRKNQQQQWELYVYNLTQPTYLYVRLDFHAEYEI